MAGTGSFRYGGDGGPAISAQLGADLPALAVDAAGDIFLSDRSSNRVRTVTPAGTITRVAGNSPLPALAGGFSGDGSLAVNAQLDAPAGLASDGSAALYIADTGNCRVRKVSAGVIATVAGTGTCETAGDGGPAVSAQLSIPEAVAVDAAHNLYIAGGDCRVRKVDPAAGRITTVVGTGICGYFGDGGPARAAHLGAFVTALVFDRAGKLLIADHDNCAVRRVDTAGFITTVSGNGSCGPTDSNGDGGPATSARVDTFGVAVDGSGALYVAGACSVRRVDPVSGVITTLAGVTSFDGCGFAGDGGPAASAMLDHPMGLVVANGVLYIADGQNARVRAVVLAGP